MKKKMTTMYSLKPIIRHDNSIDRSRKCMYEMKNIHGDGHSRQECRIMSTVNEQVINFLKNPLPEIAVLETRQEKILSQLAELKQQVLNLCNVLNENKGIEKTDSCSLKPLKRDPINVDLVLNVHPSNPCYSVLALKKLWNYLDFRISPFVHSNVDRKVPDGFGKSESCGKTSSINLSLIWKNVNDTELVFSGIHGSSILGEVNLLRYLARLLDNYDSLSAEKTTNIDRILDLSHQLIYQESQRDKQMIINILDQKIAKENWFSGDKKPGISDVAAWSAIKQTSSKTLPTNLSSWFKNCEKIFLN